MIKLIDQNAVREIAEQVQPNHSQSKPQDFVAQVASEIIRQFLGKIWDRKHFVRKHSKYFQGMMNFEVNQHIIEIAEALYNLQNIEGIDHIHSRIIEKKRLEKDIAPLRVAHYFKTRQLPFRFLDENIRKPDGTPTPDMAFTYEGVEGTCEVKCKGAVTTLKPTTIERSIKEGKDQVDDGRPALVGIFIPDTWPTEAASEAFQEATDTVFRAADSGKLSAVIMLSRHFWTAGPNSSVMAYRSKFFENPNASINLAGMVKFFPDATLNLSGIRKGVNRFPPPVEWVKLQQLLAITPDPFLPYVGPPIPLP